MCHLHYVNNLLIMMAGDTEDFRIIKLILYLFEGISRILINFQKTCLFTSRSNLLPYEHLSQTLHCARGLLPVHYLSLPILGKQPRRQDWETLIGEIHSKFTSCKSWLLSLGGRLMLVNFVLSTIPTYCMSIFKLLSWVIKNIDNIRRDFLWSGSDINHPKMRLVN